MNKNTVYTAFQKNPLVWIVTAFISGIFISRLFVYPLIPIVCSVILFVYLFSTHKNLHFLVGLLIIIFMLGWGWSSYRQLCTQRTLTEIEHYNEQDVQFTGIVYNIKNSQYGYRWLVENLDLQSKSSFTKAEFQVFFYSKEKYHANVGDTILVTGGFSKFLPIRNPGDFDFRTWAHRQGIFGKLIQEKGSSVFVTPSERATWLTTLEKIRAGIRTQFQRTTEGKTPGMLSALILGDKSDVDPELKSSFVETGVIHVLAVSGLHVGYILMILLILTSMTSVPWGSNRIIIIVGLAGFVILTGGKPSVVRASIMAALYVLAPVANRPRSTWNIIAASALIMLMWNPMSVFDLGFQLSYSAVISIVYFYQLFERTLPKKLQPNNIKNNMLRNVWSLFLVSASAQIGTLPLTILYFHRIPIISLLANIIIVPLIGVLVALGILILTIGWIPYLGYLFGQSAWLVTQLIDISATVFSSVPFASVDMPMISVSLFWYYGLGVGIIILLMNKKKSKAVLLSCALVLCVIWAWAFKDGGTDVIFLDVGQGDAAIIMIEDGRNMLNDAGQRNRRGDYGEKVVVPVARRLGIDRFNWVVWSHPHSDHIGGMITVLEEIPVDTVWDTYAEYGSWTYNHLLEMVEEKEIEYHQPHRGDVIPLDNQSYIQIFSPDSAWCKDVHNVNNMSIVMRIVVGNTSFLFTGDMEHEGDALLLPLKDYIKSDVLKVGHHGSITSSTEEDIQCIQPKIAVISVGHRNKFRHPSNVVLNRLEGIGATIYRTDKHGAVWLRTDGKQIEVVAWR